MGVTTRVAATTDLPTLTELDRHVSTDLLPELVGAGRVMVAEVDGEVVGFLRWGLFWDAVPFMHLLWVLPERRDQGIGTTLATHWEAERRSEDHAFVLTSTVSAERSQHLYRRLGYVDSGALLLPDEPAELFLRKDLTAR